MGTGIKKTAATLRYSLGLTVGKMEQLTIILG
jgi:hypothetical protein